MEKLSGIAKSESLTPISLQSRIDEIGFGPFQITTIAMSAMALLYAGGLRQFIKITMGESNFLSQNSMFFAFLEFFGFSIGCLLSFLSGRLGRRPAVVIGLVLMGLCSYCASISVSFQGMFFHLFLAQIGLGLSLPSSLCLAAEVSPQSVKGVAVSLTLSFMIVGEVFAILMEKILPAKNFCQDMASICPLQLRMECLSVPLVLASAMAAVALYESPFALQEDLFTLNKTLKKMETENGKQLTSKHFTNSPSSLTRSVHVTSATVVVIGLMFGLAEVVMGAVPESHALVSSVSSFFSLCFAGLLVTMVSPRIALITAPLVILLVGACGIVSVTHPEWLLIQDHVVFSVLKSAAFSLLCFAVVYVLHLQLGVGETVGVIAVATGIGKGVATLLPLHVGYVQVEAAIAALAAIAAIAGLSVLNDYVPPKTNRLYESGRFSKIPIVMYGTENSA